MKKYSVPVATAIGKQTLRRQERDMKIILAFKKSSGYVPSAVTLEDCSLPHSMFMCSVYLSQYTATIFLNGINRLLLGVLYEVERRLMCRPHLSVCDLSSVTKPLVRFP